MASRNGGSKDVDAVIPKAKFFVTAAIAEMGYYRVRWRPLLEVIDLALTIVGSVTGH